MISLKVLSSAAVIGLGFGHGGARRELRPGSPGASEWRNGGGAAACTIRRRRGFRGGVQRAGSRQYGGCAPVASVAATAAASSRRVRRCRDHERDRFVPAPLPARWSAARPRRQLCLLRRPGLLRARATYDDQYYDDGARCRGRAGAGGDDAVAYCMQTYRSYDPASGTYLGYRRLSAPLPVTEPQSARWIGAACVEHRASSVYAWFRADKSPYPGLEFLPCGAATSSRLPDHCHGQNRLAAHVLVVDDDPMVCDGR